jgi:hypothetical protein
VVSIRRVMLEVRGRAFVRSWECTKYKHGGG